MIFMMTLLWLVLGITAVVSGIYLAHRARAVASGGVDAADHAHLARRVLQLEEDLEAMRADLRRLEAGQEFTTNLLAQRASPSTARPGAEGQANTSAR